MDQASVSQEKTNHSHTVRLVQTGQRGACLWWISDNQTRWASQQDAEPHVSWLGLNTLQSLREHTGAPWHTLTYPTRQHAAACAHTRARAPRRHIGLHETRTARFKVNVVNSQLSRASLAAGRADRTSPSLTRWLCMIATFYNCDCQEAPALLWQQGMRVGLLRLGCGQSEALWGRTRASRDHGAV